MGNSVEIPIEIYMEISKQKDLFSPVFIAILASNLLIIIIALCFKHTRTMLNIGYRTPTIIICLILLRLLFIVELPYAKVIVLPNPISRFISFLLHPFNSIHGIEIRIWTIILLTITLISIKKIAQYLSSYHNIKRQILIEGNLLTKTEPYFSILEQICKSQNRKNCFQVIEWSGVHTPSLIGILKPYILIPVSYQLTPDDLYIILRHEAAHHFHNDLLIKAVVKCFSLLYWWNPACRILNNQTDLLLEIRIDDKMASENEESKINYLNCLVRVADTAAENMPQKPSPMISICSSKSLINKRFEIMLHPKKHLNFYAAAPLIISAIIIIFSYVFTFTMRYTPPEIADRYFTIDDDNGYAIYNEEGKYNLYLYGNYIETVDSLEYYPYLTKIYKEGEYINEN